MKKLLKFFWKLIEKEASWLKGACAEAKDQILLFWRNQEMEALNLRLRNLDEDERLGWEVDPVEKRDILAKLSSKSEVYNEILLRIRARDAQHQEQKQEVAVQ